MAAKRSKRSVDHTDLMSELRQSLAASDSRARKSWANEIVDGRIPLESLLPLFFDGGRTSQRFMWLIGDVCELDATVVEPCLPILFSLIDEVQFPGMPRSMAKWLQLTNVPSNIEKLAIPRLFQWLSDDTGSVACRSFTAKVLFNLAVEKRVAVKRVERLLSQQSQDKNPAFAHRMEKLFNRLKAS